MKITHDMVPHPVMEYEVFQFCAEASELRLPVGKFPNSIETDLGNKQNFIAIKQNWQNGELKSVQYKQLFGCILLEIFND